MPETNDQNTKPPANTPPVIDENAPVTRKINGQDVTRPLSEWLGAASKWEGLGGDKLKAEADTARKLTGALRTMNNESEPWENRRAASAEICRAMGLTPEQTANHLAALDAAHTNGNTQTGDQELEDTSENTPDPALLQAIEELKNAQATQKKTVAAMLQQTFETITGNAVDTNPKVSVQWKAIQSAHGPEVLKVAKAQYAELLKGEVYRLAQARKEQTGNFNPSYFAEVLPEAETAAQAKLGLILGALSSPGRATDTTARQKFGTVDAPANPKPGATRDVVEDWTEKMLLHEVSKALGEAGKSTV